MIRPIEKTNYSFNWKWKKGMRENLKRLPSDLLIILVWVIFTIIFVVTPVLADNSIRSILGIPFVVMIPGYVLISALFPRKDELNNIERIALSFGLSIAVVPLIGLLLNYTPFGIGLESILISLTIYIVLLIIVSIYRRFKIVENERFSIPFRNIYLFIINGITIPIGRIDKILSILLIIFMIVAIGMVIYIITVPKTGEKFTEFYVLNSSTEKADYNTNLKIDRPVKYLIGVANHEYKDVNYTIKAEIGEDILLSKNLKIENDEEWEDNFTIVPNKKGDDMKLKFLLFKENNLTLPYRELYLWVNVS